MGAIGGLVGLGGGAGGTGFAGPQMANIQNPVTADQIKNSYDSAQSSMGGQQQLLQALQAQQGINNQSQVYGQLQGVASGAVNPAQAQFANNTQANVANQAALMAGQRGASQNVGLMARQAAQQGAGIQQQAVGQEAAQQAQNQIAAIGQAGQLATTQAGQQIGQTNANVQAQQAEQQQLLNAQGAFNTAQVGMQSNINQANAGLASTTMQGQQGLIGGAMNGAAAILGAGGGEVKRMAGGGWSQVGATEEVPAGQGPTSDPSRQPLQFAVGDTGQTSQPAFQGQSKFGQFLHAANGAKDQKSQGVMPSQTTAGASALQTGAGNLIGALGKKKKPAPNDQDQGSDSDDLSANAPVYGPTGGPTSADAMGITSVFGMPQAAGGSIKDFRVGGKVNAASPKEKAVKKGNDYANDKIPAVLSEHEIVLPRSVTLSKDPVGEAAKFVSSVIAKRKGRK